MSNETEDQKNDGTGEDGGEGKRKRGPLGIILVLILALAAGGGAFFAAWSGMLPFGGHAEGAHAEGGADHDGEHDNEGPTDAPNVSGSAHGATDAAEAMPAFVTLPPIAVSVGAGGADRQLRVQPVLEVEASAVEAVAALEPRLRDMLLGYLRALEPAVLEDPIALLRMRAQMLRRARMVTSDAGLGDHAVADLLVTDFVLN